MLKAMIVEDNIFFREMFKNWLLTQYPSTEIIEAGSGEEALKWLGSYAFDLVFMDIHLPGENGLEITRKIKAEWQEVSVIILSSYDMPEYREAAIRYGANSFIAKDSLKWNQISAMVKCFQRAKDSIGLKPSCVRLASEGSQ
jgi:DNA-binding NarL/FixJ family response regulator